MLVPKKNLDIWSLQYCKKNVNNWY